jgi:cystathionine beta-lyase/cystathionine gamma-synthase
MATNRMHPETAVLTRGFDPRLSVGAARPPVYRTSTYVFSSPESAERAFAIALGKTTPNETDVGDLIYARLSHPNAEIVEDQLVPLEPGAQAAAVFNSGMAAISTVLLGLLAPGAAIVYTLPLYGGTHHLIQNLITPLGINARPVRAGDTRGLKKAIEETQNLRLVLIETPANPTLVMTDISAAASAIKGLPERAMLAVDNTLLGPTFQHPLAHGADLVIYSATKFLGGFSDLLAGVIMASDAELVARMRRLRALLGNILQADECWILDSRLSTVSLRMNRQSKNAQRIADRLADHPALRRVYYPSLFSDPDQCRIRDAQTDFPGSLMTLEFRAGKPAAFDFLRRLKIARNAVSLGGVESLACHPATTTHSELSAEDMEQAGINDSMVRVSIGTEHWRDLLEDFLQALK